MPRGRPAGTPRPACAAPVTRPACFAVTKSTSFFCADLQLGLVKRGARGSSGGAAASGGTVGSVRTAEDAVERVVVVGRDRVELVVVAAGAGDRQAHQAAGDDVDPVVDDVVRVVHEAPAERQEAHRRQRPAVVAWAELVGGELLDHEPVVGQVLVERADDVVAVGAGPGVLLAPR